MNYILLRDEIIKKYESKYIIYINSIIKRSQAVIQWNFINYSKEEYDNPNSSNIFTLLHEIGHLETNTLEMCDCQQEFLATQWAIKQMKKYKFNISKKRKNEYQQYIWNFDLKNKDKYILKW